MKTYTIVQCDGCGKKEKAVVMELNIITHNLYPPMNWYRIDVYTTDPPNNAEPDYRDCNRVSSLCKTLCPDCAAPVLKALKGEE